MSSKKNSYFPDYYSELGLNDNNEVKSAEEINHNDEKKETLSMDDFTVSIEKKRRDTHKNQTLLLDIELLDKMKTIKQETGLSLSTITNKALEIFLNNVKIKK